MSETTLAQALNDAFDKAEQTPEPTPAAPAAPAPAPEVDPDKTDPAITAPAEEKVGRTAGRARDEHGRLLPGPAKRVETPAVIAPAAAQVEEAPPSSWKKEHWESYRTLPLPVQKYIKQREEQYIGGVTTYRQEAEAAREVREALAPFEQDFRMAGVTPAQGVAKLAETHRAIRAAPPEAKIQIFQRLAQEYGVPLHAVQSGQVDPVMQYLTPLQQQIEQLRLQQNSWQEQQQNAERTSMQTEIETFAAEHEHFDAVRPVMAGLLQSGLAKDLTSAYEKAVRMDESLAAAPQPAVPARSNPQVIQRARSAAVSTKSATPAGSVAASGKKDVRSILEETVDQFLGGARV